MDYVDQLGITHLSFKWQNQDANLRSGPQTCALPFILCCLPTVTYWCELAPCLNLCAVYTVCRHGAGARVTELRVPCTRAHGLGGRRTNIEWDSGFRNLVQ